uniref:Calponin-homology (CH) domain-containing protein n=1 Tax=Parastrongyloides trichosuri TaxID=131310 RepID=A0A0N4ZUR7_PARTI
MSGMKKEVYDRGDNLSRISEECHLTSRENSLSSMSSGHSRNEIMSKNTIQNRASSAINQDTLFDSKEFLSGTLLKEKLTMEERNFCKENVIIKDDPRFDRSKQVKEHSWEPSVFEYSSPHDNKNTNPETPRRSVGRNELKEKLQAVQQANIKKFQPESVDDTSNGPGYFTSTPIRDNNVGQSRLFSNYDLPNISTIAVDNSVLFQEFMTNLLKRKNAGVTNCAKNIVFQSATDITKKRRYSSSSSSSIGNGIRNLIIKEKFLHFGLIPINCQSFLPLNIQNNCNNVLKCKLEFKGKGRIFSLDEQIKNINGDITLFPNKSASINVFFDPDANGLYQDTLYLYYGVGGISDKPKQKVPIAGICGTTNVQICENETAIKLIKVPNINLEEYLFKTSVAITKFSFSIRNNGTRKAFVVMLPFKINPNTKKCELVEEHVNFLNGSHIVLDSSSQSNIVVSHRMPRLFEILQEDNDIPIIEEIFRIVVMSGDETQRLRLKEAEQISKSSYEFEGQTLTKINFINESPSQSTFVLGDVECEGKIMEKGISRSIISFCFQK